MFIIAHVYWVKRCFFNRRQAVIITFFLYLNNFFLYDAFLFKLPIKFLQFIGMNNCKNFNLRPNSPFATLLNNNKFILCSLQSCSFSFKSRALRTTKIESALLYKGFFIHIHTLILVLNVCNEHPPLTTLRFIFIYEWSASPDPGGNLSQPRSAAAIYHCNSLRSRTKRQCATRTPLYHRIRSHMIICLPICECMRAGG